MRTILRIIQKLLLPLVFFVALGLGVLTWMGHVAQQSAEQVMHEHQAPTTIRQWHDLRVAGVDMVRDGGGALREAMADWAAVDEPTRPADLSRIRRALDQQTVTLILRADDRRVEVTELQTVAAVGQALLAASEVEMQAGRADQAAGDWVRVLRLSAAVRAIPRMQALSLAQQLRRDVLGQIETLTSRQPLRRETVLMLIEAMDALLPWYHESKMSAWAALPMTQMFVLLETPEKVSEIYDQQTDWGRSLPAVEALQSRETIHVFGSIHGQLATSRNLASALFYISNRNDLVPGWNQPLAKLHRLALGDALTPERRVSPWMATMREAADVEAMLRLARAGLVLHLDRRMRGRWSETWELVLPTPPLDSYTAEPIVVKRLEAGLILQSPGFDGRFGTEDDLTWTLSAP